MKIPAIILLLLASTATLAQNYQGMNEQDMQKMMQQMQKMESCMQNVDQTKLKALEQRSSRFEAEVKSLCANGKRDEAEAKAISFGKEISEEPSMQTMKKCSAMMKGVMPAMPFSGQPKDTSSRHICD